MNRQVTMSVIYISDRYFPIHRRFLYNIHIENLRVHHEDRTSVVHRHPVVQVFYRHLILGSFKCRDRIFISLIHINGFHIERIYIHPFIVNFPVGHRSGFAPYRHFKRPSTSLHCGEQGQARSGTQGRIPFSTRQCQRSRRISPLRYLKDSHILAGIITYAVIKALYDIITR